MKMSKNQPFRTFEATKKLNLDRWTAFAKATAVKRDKIEPICSPKMYVERTPKCRSPASRGITKLAGNVCTSTPIFSHPSQGKFASHYARPVRFIVDRSYCAKLVRVLL